MNPAGLEIDSPAGSDVGFWPIPAVSGAGRHDSYPGLSCRSQLSAGLGLNSATRPLLPITAILDSRGIG
jgi:hypothetical protein